MVPVLMHTPPTTSFRSMRPTCLAELGGLDGGLLAGRSSADDQKVVVRHEDLNGRVRPNTGMDRARWSDLPRLSQLTVISFRAT